MARKTGKETKPVVDSTSILAEYDDKMYSAILNKHRTVFLYGVITNSQSEKINKKIMALAIEKPNVPIILEINSCGGSCVAGLSIVDTLLCIPCPIYTVISGLAASMATFISIVGDKRLIRPNAYWMAHPIASMKSDYLGFLKDSMEWLNDLEKRCLDIYRKYTNIPENLIIKCQRGEVWLNAKKCKKYSIVDKVLKDQIFVAEKGIYKKVKKAK